MGCAVTSWLVRSALDRTVRVRALARDIVLCPLARLFTLTMPLFTQVYKFNAEGIPVIVASHQGGSKNSPSCFKLQSITVEKRRPNEAPESYAAFFPLHFL